MTQPLTETSGPASRLRQARTAPPKFKRPYLMTPRVVLALMLREMSATHGRSVGGYLWLILEPVLGIMLLTLIFSYGLRTPRLGINFPIFFATGILPFMFFNTVAGNVSSSINYSRALLGYPRVTYVDAIVARALLSGLTQLLVSFIILTGIVIYYDTRTVFHLNTALLTYGMAFALALGIGTFNCFLFTMYPLWQRAWSILTRPLFIISGVFILYETFPRALQEILWYNPLLHVTAEMRDAFYLQYEAVWVSPLYVFGVAAVTGTLGMVFLHRYHRDMLER
jgi:capsular polysaccharide transport system permease protein